jgi:hypothetical protein
MVRAQALRSIGFMRTHPRFEPTSTSSHTARYLILLGAPDAKRALLFSGECEYMAEMIDEDGLMLDDLLRSSTVCPPPRELGLDDNIVASCTANEMLLCFALGS